MTTYDEARANRIAAATPQEWRDLVADMLDEMKAFDDAVESKAIRYVKTPAGARKYGEPIGAPIRPNAPKLNYVRNGPKKRSAGPAPSSTGSGSSPSFRSADVSAEATKKVTELTPGERSREKARLAKVVKDDPKNSSLEKRRLSDIEEHENELDQTIRNPKRDISGVTGDKKPKESPSAPKPAAGGRVGEGDQTREQAFAPGTNERSVPVRELTGNSIKKQMDEIANQKNRSKEDDKRFADLDRERVRRDKADPPKPAANDNTAAKTPDVLQVAPTGGDLTPAERAARSQAFPPDVNPTKVQPNRLTDGNLKLQLDGLAKKKTKNNAEAARLDALASEARKRGIAVAPTATPRGGDTNGVPLNGLTESGLRSEERRLLAVKKRTPDQTRRLLEVRLESNRRAGRAANAQARGLGRLKLPGQKSLNPIDYRFEVDAKAFALVGDGDWDCSDMDDDDIDFFLAKSLRGRPTVEKLQMANSLLTERAARVEADEPEVKELTWEVDETKVRHVRTAEGSRLFDRPIGAPITGRSKAKLPQPVSSGPGGTSEKPSAEPAKQGTISPKFVLEGDKVKDVTTVDGDVLKGSYYVSHSEDGGDTESLKPTTRLSLISQNGVVFTERVYTNTPLKHLGRQLDEMDKIKPSGPKGYRDAMPDDYKPFRD